MPGETTDWNKIDGHRNIYVNRIPCIAASRLIIQDAFEIHFNNRYLRRKIGSPS